MVRLEVSDETEGRSSAVLRTNNITVTNTNDAPVLGNNALTISEGGTVTLSATELSATAPLKVATRASGFRAATMPGFSPAMVPALRLDQLPDVTLLSWDPPHLAGAISVAYDTLRSTAPGDFGAMGECVEDQDATDLSSEDC